MTAYYSLRPLSLSIIQYITTILLNCSPMHHQHFISICLLLSLSIHSKHYTETLMRSARSNIYEHSHIPSSEPPYSPLEVIIQKGSLHPYHIHISSIHQTDSHAIYQELSVWSYMYAVPMPFLYSLTISDVSDQTHIVQHRHSYSEWWFDLNMIHDTETVIPDTIKILAIH